MLTFNDVSNRLWDKSILKNINWATESGQSWAILGPNGAGKTTLVKLILGQIPYCGVIKRDGKISNLGEIAHVSLEQQNNLVAREEKKDLFEDYSGNEEHLLTGLEYMDPQGEKTEETLNIAEKLGIKPLLGNPVRYYSNGETRKTLIGKALLSDPNLLILDEPFEGLDINSVIWLKQTISSLISKGLAILLVSNRVEDLVPEITHVLCLKSGEVFAKGKKSDVLTPTIMNSLYKNKKFEEEKGENLHLTNEFVVSNPVKISNIRNQDPVIMMKKVMSLCRIRMMNGHYMVLNGVYIVKNL